MKIQTGLFGGSFNPIHNGHLLLARHLLKEEKLDEIWFMVSPQNPFKQKQDQLDDKMRMELVELAVANEPKMKACDFEFGLPRPSYTWNTLQQLQKVYPERDFTLIIGADNWLCFDKWYHAADIEKSYPIVIYPRQGADVSRIVLPPNVAIVDTPLIDISSTEVRDRLGRNEPINGLVPDSVERKIKEEGLYR